MANPCNQIPNKQCCRNPNTQISPFNWRWLHSLPSSLKRVDNSSLPLSFPTSKTKNTNKIFLKRIPRFLSMPFNSVLEFGRSLLKSTFVEDDKTAIRSGFEAAKYRPSKISNVAFPINHIKEIKSNLGVSINDVITGIIFYGIRLYMQDIDHKSKTLKSTALVMANTRDVNACDEKGGWKRVEVKLEEHITEPKFIDGLSVDLYDRHFSDYLSRISMEKLPPTKPLWQVHVIKYPTSNAEGTLVLKFSHAIGDGYILMGLLLSKLQRADNPSVSLSFPSLKSSKPKKPFKSFLKRIHNFVPDFGWSLLKSTLLEDDKTPIRSGIEAVEFQPTKVSHITFPMDHIKEIKSNLGVTINNLITGIIVYGIRLYMQDIDYKSRRLNSTSLLITNTRNIKTYQSVQDMLKPANGAWGNQITYLLVSIPKLVDIPISSPLQFVRKAHTSIKRKRNSFATRLITKLLLMKSKFEGPEAVAKDIHRTIRKSSLLISNVAGPLGKMAWANHHIGGFFFTLSGIPQSLIITIMSYMGMLRVTAKTEDGFIDEQKLMWYLKKSFEIIRHDSIAKENVPSKMKFYV